MSLTSNEMFAELLDQGFGFDFAYNIVSKVCPAIDLKDARYIHALHVDIVNTKAKIQITTGDDDYLCESLVDLQSEYAEMRTLGVKVA